MSSDRTLKHHRLEVVDSRLDEGLIGILFENSEDILLEFWQEELFEPCVGDFHQKRMHRMTSWAQRVAAQLDQRFGVDLVLKLNDLRA